MEIIEILKDHAARYPLMQPCDAVKLIYQNEFGGGHLINDAEQSLSRIYAEYDAVAHDPSMPLFEDIGNGIVRVNLAAIDTIKYPLEKLNDEFVKSSMAHKGALESFVKKLDALLKQFDRIGLSFSKNDLNEYLNKYERAGYPMVSHSEIYRDAYKPAYRVVLKQTAD